MLVHTRDGTQVTVVMMLLHLIVIGHGYAMMSKSIYGHKPGWNLAQYSFVMHFV